MTTTIFVNLPVKNLDASKDFFSQLGYSFNPQFTNENAACMVISDNIYAMLLTEPFFKNFTNKNLVDAKQSTEVLLCLSTTSRNQVDDIVGKAVAAGGRIYKQPQDHGFMYIHSFEDLDGHQWEYMFMNAEHVQQ